MLQSLKDVVREPYGTKSAILLALKSHTGLRKAWIVVEAEEDVAVYEHFMRPDTTIVKTSVDSTGRKGYGNVEKIVHDVKEEESRAHIIGIRDADYLRYKDGYVPPVNIFLTDRRDLEMTLLEAESVKQALRTWVSTFDEAYAKCILLCRYFGYLRIYNEIADLSVVFHKNLRPTKYWDFTKHCIQSGWEQDCTAKFVALAEGKCSDTDVSAFVDDKTLEVESDYDICRGHDLLSILSLVLIKKEYSEKSIMLKMIEAYSLDDFKATQLYANIKEWQITEDVNVLVA